MKTYIISQIAFLLGICALRFGQIFWVSDEIIRKILWGLILVIVFIMSFVQGYLQSVYNISDSMVSWTYLGSAVVFVAFELVVNRFLH